MLSSPATPLAGPKPAGSPAVRAESQDYGLSPRHFGPALPDRPRAFYNREGIANVSWSRVSWVTNVVRHEFSREGQLDDRYC